MLSIRMQRTGRKGHAMFRVIVQESRLTPTSGKIVAMLGSYDPPTKIVTLEKDKASLYLKNGAQPSERAASLLKREGVDLPKWVKASTDKKRVTRKPEKLRKNQPAQPKETKEEVATEEVAEAPEAETPTEPLEVEAVAEALAAEAEPEA